MAKVINLNKNETLDQLQRKLQPAQQSIKGINAKVYSGIITLHEESVAYQKRMRHEWN